MEDYVKTVERIRMLCKRRGITVNALEIQLGFAVSTIGKWGRHNKPSLEKLIKVADFFNVSVDYLLCRTDIKNTDFLNDEEIIVLQRARENMSQRDRVKMMQMLRIGFDYAFEDGNTQPQTTNTIDD